MKKKYGMRKQFEEIVGQMHTATLEWKACLQEQRVMDLTLKRRI